jgi:anthranilate synthase component 1
MTRYLPSFDEFARLARNARLVPVYRQLLSDTLTPVSAYCCIRSAGGDAFLFESVVGGEMIGRYSFVGADPFLNVSAFERNVTVSGPDGTRTHASDDPLTDLQSLLDQYPAVHLPGLPRFCGGAVGYAGYDVIRYSERLPHPPQDDRRLPDLSFALYDRMVIFDHINKTVLVVAHARGDATDLTAEYERTRRRVDELCARLQTPPPELKAVDIAVGGDPQLASTSDCTQADYEAAVERCKEYIRAGTFSRSSSANG